MAAKVGAAALATCVVRTLNESDPSFEKRFLENLDIACDRFQRRHPQQGTQDVLEMLNWTRELLTGWNDITGQGEPLLPSGD
jgi:hypothetical protein